LDQNYRIQTVGLERKARLFLVDFSGYGGFAVISACGKYNRNWSGLLETPLLAKGLEYFSAWMLLSNQPFSTKTYYLGHAHIP